MIRSNSQEAKTVPTPVQNHLVLVLLAGELAAWRLEPGSAPQPVLLLGQARLPVKKQDIADAYLDVSVRLRDEGIAVGALHWVADAEGRVMWASSQSKPQAFPDSPWQLLAWECLAGRFGMDSAKPWATPDLLESVLLPWIATADDATERRHMQEALASEHHTEAERLAGERSRLQQENERLRSQNAALQQVDAERLVSFLPALFPRVFTVLGVADLALLCGRVEPLSIPNPYPEPSEETLRTLQMDFRALPRELQRHIVRFVSRLPQRQKLQARPEMRDLLRQLEQD